MIALTTALVCMQANIYFEARGEHVMGQYAVAHVVMNRAKDKAHVCKTVLARKQFSWTSTYVIVKHGRAYIEQPADMWSWSIAGRIAMTALRGKVTDITHGANSFHATYVHPSWAAGQPVVYRIDRHKFFALNDRK